MTDKEKQILGYQKRPGNKNLAKLKRDYLDLVLKISKLRSKGKEPTFEVLKLAQDIGRLAHISEQQIDKNLFGKISSSQNDKTPTPHN